VIPEAASVRSFPLVLALLAAGCGAAQDSGPEPPPFHGGRAWAHLGQQIAFGPRYPGDRGNARQLAWLLEELGFRADSVVRQRFTFAGEGGRPVAGTNVLARFRPELEDRVLLVAHRDTRRRADGSPDPLDRRFPVPGANVNASGVAVLLELAELFRQQPPPVGVDLLFTDADEYAADRRMAGLRHFLAEAPGYRARYAVVLQGVAAREPRIAKDAASLREAPEPTERLWSLAARLGADGVFVPDTAPALAGQAAVLCEAGIPVVVVAEREYGLDHSLWQALADRMDHVSAETLEAVGRAVAALLYGEPAGG
jgi:glutaminyl-peptide cyclotransferase